MGVCEDMETRCYHVVFNLSYVNSLHENIQTFMFPNYFVYSKTNLM